jgi:peroxiredoxin
MKRLIILVVICLICTEAVIVAQNNPEKKTPPVTLKDINGKTVSLSQYKGKIILLNFWATWCPPCKAEIPELIKWQKEFQNRGLQIIGITYPPTNRIKVRNFVRSKKINYPILYGSKKTKALFDSGETMPLTVVIDRDGNIKEIIEGVIFSEEFDEKVKPLMELSSKKKAGKIQ